MNFGKLPNDNYLVELIIIYMILKFILLTKLLIST